VDISEETLNDLLSIGKALKDLDKTSGSGDGS